MSSELDKLMAQLKADFDIVIIDTAPVGVVADAQIISRHSDVNLYIVRQRYTLKNNLEIVNELQQGNKMKNLYLVINDVKKGSSYRYGYQYGYGYSYYAYGDSPKSGWNWMSRKSRNK